VCGERPFQSETFPDLVIKICSEEPRPPSSWLASPPAFDSWFARAVQRDPEQRFQSARELAHALREAASGSEPTTSAAPVAEPAAPRPPPPTAVLARSQPVEARDITQHATANTQPDV